MIATEVAIRLALVKSPRTQTEPDRLKALYTSLAAGQVGETE